jgi:TatD DNase family protein
VFIDSHTHLDHCKEDAAALVADAAGAGVGLIIQSGIDLERSRQSVAMAERFPQVFATVGFHPQEAGLLDDEGRAAVQELARHPRVVGVGETGFDFYHDNWPHDVQEAAFLFHLDLARRMGLPVVIHTRDAAERTLAVLAQHGEGLTVILHCFSLPDRLDEVVGRGYYISFAGNMTYKNAPALQAAAAAAPAHLLLLETDAPWLTPVPMRGRPNRPALVAAVYEFVAGLRGVESEVLAAQVEENVLRAFPRIAAARAAAGVERGVPPAGPGPESA